MGQGFDVGNYQVVSSTRVGRTLFEYVLRVSITNKVATAQGLTAQVFSRSTNTVVIQGNVSFGDLAFGASTISSNTITIRQDRSAVFDPTALQWFVTAQSMPLAVTIDTPVSGLLTNGTNVVISGTVGPAVHGVLVGRTNAALTGNNFTAVFPLEEGRNIITVLATNSFGGVGSGNVTVNRDTTPPILSVDTPASGAVLASRQLTVTGQINDAVPGTVNPEQATVTVNGLSATLLNRSYSVADVLLVPGRNTINVVAHDRAGNETRKQIEVTFQDPASQKRLVALGGDAQSGMVGTLLPQPLVIELVDGDGVAQTNQPVTFTVSRNDGTLFASPESGRSLILRTDDKGQARVSFMLGTRTGSGNNQVEVTSPGVSGKLLFGANAFGSPPAKVSPLIPETQVGEVGKPLPQPWTAFVTDDGGNPVSGAPIMFMVFQGDGRIAGATTVSTNTDSDGRASVVLTLGQAAGVNNNIVYAIVPGVTNSSAVFTASAQVPQAVKDTRVVGLVLDHANRPMSNILCIIYRTTLAAVTDAQGQFVISNAPVGAIRLFVDARDRGYPGEWHTLEFDLVTVAGRDNSVDRPIYMLPLDAENAVIAGGDQDVTLHLKGMPGATMTVFAHSLHDSANQPFTNQVTWTQVNVERMPMAPPLGSQPRLVWTVQPAGLRFNPPARICIPNVGAPAGQLLEMFGFDHDLGAFVSLGTATVTADGSEVCSDPGFGVTKSGWGHFSPPPPPCTPVCGPAPADTPCVHYETIPPASKCDCPTYKAVAKDGPCDDDGDPCTRDICRNGICFHEDIEPTFSISVIPYAVRPQAVTTVTVTLQPPCPNITASFRAEAVMNSGGHSHTGNRPVGTFSASTRTTGINGTCQVRYTASSFGGVETIIVTVGGTERRADLDVRVPGLVALGGGANYDLIGWTPTHPDNHYGTPTVVAAIAAIANDYHNAFPQAQVLHINDMSLERGGLFDWQATWARPHQTHREGRDVDIRLATIPVANRPTFITICINHGAFPAIHNGNHYHLDF